MFAERAPVVDHILVENFGFDDVARSAHRWVADGIPVFRRHAYGVLHWKGDHILEWAEHRFRIGHVEISGETGLRAEPVRRHAMAGKTRDAVAGQTTVNRVRAAGGDEMFMRKKGTRFVDVKLAFAHYTVAGVAGVVDLGGDRWIGQCLRFALCLKHRIASGEAHHRCAPFPEWRDVFERRGRRIFRRCVLRPRHVRLHAEREIARVVATGASVRRVEAGCAVGADDYSTGGLRGDAVGNKRRQGRRGSRRRGSGGGEGGVWGEQRQPAELGV